ncbi:MAG: serine O-acetyltransferase [Paracoccaceae bacterium]
MKLRATLRRDYDHYLRLCERPGGARLWRMLLSPRLQPMVLIRVAGWLHACGLGPLGNLVSLLVLWVFRVEVPARAVIAPGLVLPHPGGIIIGSARIGEDVVIYQNVTLGARRFEGAYDLTTRPVIGPGVTIGAGAVVLGPVEIGAGATVAANSLVNRDVPAGATALGVPAQVRPADATEGTP